MVQTYVLGVVEAQVLVQSADGLELALVQVKVGDLEVLSQTGRVVALGDDSDVTLSGPAQEDLSGRTVVLGGNAGDGGVLEQLGGVLGVLHLQLDEAERTEGGVGSDGDALLLGVVDQGLLGEVRVVLDLESGGADASVAEEVHQQLRAEVAHTDAAGELLLDEGLHGGPGLLNGGVGQLDLVLGVGPAGRVADLGSHILEGDGEVDNVQVEVVNAQVLELLAGNGLDLLLVVEAVPQLGDEEKVLTLDETVLDGASDTLADLNLVAVVYMNVVSSASWSLGDFRPSSVQ